jgi:hypothetical protein
MEKVCLLPSSKPPEPNVLPAQEREALKEAVVLAKKMMPSWAPGMSRSSKAVERMEARMKDAFKICSETLGIKEAVDWSGGVHILDVHRANQTFVKSV